MSEKDLILGILPYGAVYLVEPDLSLREKRRDLENIKKLNFNTVVLWPSVSRWDANPPGGTAFDSIDAVMEICAELGLKVILELQGQNTGNQEAPEYYRLPERIYPPDINHPEYRQLTVRYCQEVAAHFKGHPALLAYDIYNEVGHRNSKKTIWTIREFIRFLKNQYANDIQALNRAWATYYSDFESIADISHDDSDEYWLWVSVVAQRDWFRFRPHNFTDRLDEWSAAIRVIDPEAVILADMLGCDTMHNRAGGYYGVTDWSIAEHVDVLGLSCWAHMFGDQWWRQDAYRWPQFWRNALSAAQGKQVIISELMTQNQNMFPRDGSSLTDQIRLWSYQAIFNGIKGLIYWKYRPFRRGYQVAGRGLTGFSGEPNEYGRQAAEVAAFTAQHADELAGARPDDSGCAILHDHNTQDIYQAIQPQLPNFYADSHDGIFRGFWTHGITPNYLRTDDIEHGVPEWVRVLAIPCNVSVAQAGADALAAFVKHGGILLTESRFALLDQDATVWPHVPGGRLHEILGVEEKNFTARFSDEIETRGGTLVLNNDYFQELKLGANVKIAQETKRGYPAITLGSAAKGKHIHVPFLLGHKIHREDKGSLGVFSQIFEIIRPALSPAMPVIEKDSMVDVSVLLDKDGKPFLLGITNFEQQATTVRLQWQSLPKSVEGDAGATVELRGKEMHVTISARRAAAVFL